MLSERRKRTVIVVFAGALWTEQTTDCMSWAPKNGRASSFPGQPEGSEDGRDEQQPRDSALIAAARTLDATPRLHPERSRSLRRALQEPSLASAPIPSTPPQAARAKGGRARTVEQPTAQRSNADQHPRQLRTARTFCAGAARAISWFTSPKPKSAGAKSPNLSLHLDLPREAEPRRSARGLRIAAASDAGVLLRSKPSRSAAPARLARRSARASGAGGAQARTVPPHYAPQVVVKVGAMPGCGAACEGGAPDPGLSAPPCPESEENPAHPGRISERPLRSTCARSLPEPKATSSRQLCPLCM